LGPKRTACTWAVKHEPWWSMELTQFKKPGHESEQGRLIGGQNWLIYIYMIYYIKLGWITATKKIKTYDRIFGKDSKPCVIFHWLADGTNSSSFFST
jgi:hypothetical protein